MSGNNDKSMAHASGSISAAIDSAVGGVVGDGKERAVGAIWENEMVSVQISKLRGSHGAPILIQCADEEDYAMLNPLGALEMADALVVAALGVGDEWAKSYRARAAIEQDDNPSVAASYEASANDLVGALRRARARRHVFEGRPVDGVWVTLGFEERGDIRAANKLRMVASVVGSDADRVRANRVDVEAWQSNTMSPEMIGSLAEIACADALKQLEAELRHEAVVVAGALASIEEMRTRRFGDSRSAALEGVLAALGCDPPGNGEPAEDIIARVRKRLLGDNATDPSAVND